MRTIIKFFYCIFLIFPLLLAGCTYFTKDKDNEEVVTTNSGEAEMKDQEEGKKEDKDVNIIFLHHSTGEQIWNGGVSQWFEKYNKENDTKYNIVEQNFPKDSPYGWENYPYDYWNIWVNNAGDKEFKEEPTLEILTQKYDVIVFKHCFPVSDIGEDTGNPDISSSDKTIGNYKLQYEALKEKMHEFPDNKFIVWTGAAQVEEATTPEYAERAKTFFDWVKNEWDEKDDNIYIWDFYGLETEGNIYLKEEYVESLSDSHPNSAFSQKAAPLFCKKVVDVIEGDKN